MKEPHRLGKKDIAPLMSPAQVLRLIAMALMTVPTIILLAITSSGTDRTYEPGEATQRFFSLALLFHGPMRIALLVLVGLGLLFLLASKFARE